MLVHIATPARVSGPVDLLYKIVTCVKAKGAGHISRAVILSLQLIKPTTF